MVNPRSITAVFTILLLAAGFLVADHAVSAGQEPDEWVLTSPTPKNTHFSEYRGVAIGSNADLVRQKLGEPKERGDEQDLYVFSESECAQFYYDAGHVVTAIMITYSGDLTAAPTALQVLGEDAPPRPDGGVSKMVRFPKAGYWISYNRSGGDDVVISIAIQKI